jgi:hypothetical protein
MTSLEGVLHRAILEPEVPAGGMMDGMNHPRQVLPSPPVDFPVYGLDASWPGSRWLESFGEAIGDPVHWVSLGHQDLNGASLIFVETFSRPRIDARKNSSGQSPLQHVAFYAAAALINVTLPVQSLSRPDGYGRALAGHADERSGQCAQWPLVRWRVDGAAAAARAWWFAGGWAAVSSAVEGAYLAAVGVGTDPDGLSLALLQDASAYHFDLDEPLHPRVMPASARAAGVQFEGAPWQRRDWHADQLRLLRELA